MLNLLENALPGKLKTGNHQPSAIIIIITVIIIIILTEVRKINMS